MWLCNSKNHQVRYWPRNPRTITTCYIFPQQRYLYRISLLWKTQLWWSLFFFLSCTQLSSLSPENANEEERKEFMDEIELMKKVGKHRNVLSFFGCWTTTKPILLMIEYIAHGDLLHWLRHKRSQVLKIITNW